MNLTTTFSTMHEIVKRLKLDMPVQVTIHDPITGREVKIDRDNILAMLVVDTPNLLADSQWLAALYMEMARARRACERASAASERAFVRWKAEIASAARAAAPAKITDKAAEEAYRTHAEYEEKANLAAYYKHLADLFDDAMEGFQLKARMIEVNSRILAGDMRAKSTEDRVEHREETRPAESTADLSRRAQQKLDAGDLPEQAPLPLSAPPPLPSLPVAPPEPSARKPRGL